MAIRGEGERVSVQRDTERWYFEAQRNDRLGGPESDSLTSELLALVSKAEWLVTALEASHGLFAAPWCIAAGAVRSIVWNHLHGFEVTAPEEIDLVHFSPAAAPNFDEEVALELARRQSWFRWDVVNQVYAHRLTENAHSPPFVSLEHAMACWPETATAVGVRLSSTGRLEVVAPLGLADLFGLVLRRGPLLRDPHVFDERLTEKRFMQRWPLLRLA